MTSETGTIVVVEDDPSIADLVDLYLRREGFRVLSASDAASGLALARRERPRLVVLDVGLPGPSDGLEVCRTLRAEGAVPIVFLTARDDEIDRIVGLELGADDYVTKPFSPRELVARVRAVLRRSASGSAAMQAAATTMSLGDVVVDLGRHSVTAGGAAVELTGREFELLSALGEHRGLVLSRRQLLDLAWGPDWIGDERTVDVHVAQLRRKLGSSLLIATVRGAGYRLD